MFLFLAVVVDFPLTFHDNTLTDMWHVQPPTPLFVLGILEILLVRGRTSVQKGEELVRVQEQLERGGGAQPVTLQTLCTTRRAHIHVHHFVCQNMHKTWPQKGEMVARNVWRCFIMGTILLCAFLTPKMADRIRACMCAVRCAQGQLGNVYKTMVVCSCTVQAVIGSRTRENDKRAKAWW